MRFAGISAGEDLNEFRHQYARACARPSSVVFDNLWPSRRKPDRKPRGAPAELMTSISSARTRDQVSRIARKIASLSAANFTAAAVPIQRDHELRASFCLPSVKNCHRLPRWPRARVRVLVAKPAGVAPLPWCKARGRIWLGTGAPDPRRRRVPGSPR